jgi:hypothetical protein
VIAGFAALCLAIALGQMVFKRTMHVTGAGRETADENQIHALQRSLSARGRR